jgi:hypothetical protein
MKKLAPLLLACAVCLWAADFWTTKPYSDWSSKELQKMMTDSPWAHRVDVELSVRMPSISSQSEGKGGRGKGGGGGGEIATAEGGRSTGADLNGPGAGAGGPAGSAGPGGNDGPVTQTMPVMLVWQTALPVKQALAKAKFGAEAATSAEAKTFLERDEPYIVLNLTGLPVTAAKAGEGDNKAALLKLTSLNIKGKDPVHALEVQFAPHQRLVDAVFFFPRAAAAAFSADDKDLEFSTKFEKLAVKYRFKLKDMLYHGKLEL